MIIGGFGLIADYLKIKEAGYDYAELDMPEIEALSDADYEKFQALVNKTGFKVLTGARLLPIVEPIFFAADFKPSSLETYLRHTCQRSKGIGITKIIMGNGKARCLTAPENIKYEPAFIDFLKMTAEIAGENGLELIFEPLGPKYSNYINKVTDACELIDKVSVSNLYVMADLRHMVWSNEDFLDLSKCIKYLRHLHIDYPLSYPERLYPRPDDGYDYAPYLNAAKQAGYDGTLTIEADIPQDWQDAHKGAMAVLEPILNA